MPQPEEAGINHSKESVHLFEARVVAVNTSGLCARLAVYKDYISGEVYTGRENAAAYGVYIYWNIICLKQAYTLWIEASRNHDLYMVEAFLIKGLTHVPYQLFIYAGRLEMTHLANQGNIYHLVRGIKANTIELITKLTGNLKAGAYAVIVEIYRATRPILGSIYLSNS